MDDGKTFGQRLRETRSGAGFSQSALEEICGIPKARLSRYENGHVAPSLQTLERLAKALGVSEASLLGDQRAFLESFCRTLSERGVQMHSAEQAARLAHAIADLWGALSGLEAEEDRCGADAAPAVGLPMALIREWETPSAGSSQP